LADELVGHAVAERRSGIGDLAPGEQPLHKRPLRGLTRCVRTGSMIRRFSNSPETNWSAARVAVALSSTATRRAAGPATHVSRTVEPLVLLDASIERRPARIVALS
jgi:hypothetical protein